MPILTLAPRWRSSIVLLLNLRRPDLRLDKSERHRTNIEHFPRSGNRASLA